MPCRINPLPNPATTYLMTKVEVTRGYEPQVSPYIITRMARWAYARIFSSFTKLAAYPDGTSTCLSDEAKAGKFPVFINVNKG